MMADTHGSIRMGTLSTDISQDSTEPSTNSKPHNNNLIDNGHQFFSPTVDREQQSNISNPCRNGNRSGKYREDPERHSSVQLSKEQPKYGNNVWTTKGSTHTMDGAERKDRRKYLMKLIVLAILFVLFVTMITVSAILYTYTTKGGLNGSTSLHTALCVPDCSNGGSCISPKFCLCSEQYTGPTCETPLCDPDCSNGGSCISPNTCSCNKQFTGPTCETLTAPTQSSTTEASTTKDVSTDMGTTVTAPTQSSSTEASNTEDVSTDVGTTVTAPTQSSTTEASTTENASTDIVTIVTAPTQSSTTEASTTEDVFTDIVTAPTQSSTTEASTTEDESTGIGTTVTAPTQSSTTEASTTENVSTNIGTTVTAPTQSSTTEASTTKDVTTEIGTTVTAPTQSSTTEANTTDDVSTDIGATVTAPRQSSTTEASTTEDVSTDIVTGDNSRISSYGTTDPYTTFTTDYADTTLTLTTKISSLPPGCHEIPFEPCQIALPHQRGTSAKDIPSGIYDSILRYSECNDDARRIMCSWYFTPCSDQRTYYPCRSTCTQFLDECFPDDDKSTTFSTWFEICQRLPESESLEICFPISSRDDRTSSDSSLYSLPKPISSCDSSPCLNNGICFTMDGWPPPFCRCPEQYAGMNCEISFVNQYQPDDSITPTIGTGVIEGSCEPLTVDQCKSILPYENTFEYISSGSRLQSAWEIVAPFAECNRKSKLLFCAEVYPESGCNPNGRQPYSICKSLCLEVREQCQIFYTALGFELDCDSYPDESSNFACVDY